jgi:hypothetical protein
LKIIRLINRGGIYENVFHSMVNPVTKYLTEDQYQIIFCGYNRDTNRWENERHNNSFDVSFFSDPSYQHDFYIAHGIADKLYSEAGVLRNFKYIGVPGQLWVEKLVNQGMDRNKIFVIGFSKLDPVFQNRKKVVNNTGKINVLYSPTHNTMPNNNNSSSSYPRFMPDLEKLYKNFNIRISNHPANKINHEVTFGDLEWAEVVISDCSSTLYESLALGIPVVFPDYIVKNNIANNFPGSFEDKIYKEKIGYHANNIEEMKDLIYKAYEHGLDQRTTDFIEGIFPTALRGKSGEFIANKFLELSGA